MNHLPTVATVLLLPVELTRSCCVVIKLFLLVLPIPSILLSPIIETLAAFFMFLVQAEL